MCVALVYRALSGVSGGGGGCLCMGPPHLFGVGSPHRGMLAVSLGVEPRLYGLTVRCTAIMLGDMVSMLGDNSNHEGRNSTSFGRSVPVGHASALF